MSGGHGHHVEAGRPRLGRGLGTDRDDGHTRTGGCEITDASPARTVIANPTKTVVPRSH